MRTHGTKQWDVGSAVFVTDHGKAPDSTNLTDMPKCGETLLFVPCAAVPIDMHLPVVKADVDVQPCAPEKVLMSTQRRLSNVINRYQ